MSLIESKRLDLKLHKATLTGRIGISTTYYNDLLKGTKQPAFSIVISMFKAVNLRLIAVDGDFKVL